MIEALPGAGRTVLLVEDNEDNQMIYSLYLEQRGGFRVLLAWNGQAGIELARKEMPDVILMDVSLPVLNGLEATRVLKADPRTRDIPIIALTAHAMLPDRTRAADAGCNGYVSKPAEPQTVLNEVLRHLPGT